MKYSKIILNLDNFIRPWKLLLGVRFLSPYKDDWSQAEEAGLRKTEALLGVNTKWRIFCRWLQGLK